MNWRNQEDHFGIVAKGLHWLMAALVLFMLGLGVYMTSLEPSPALFKYFALHKSIGIVILALVFARLLWRTINQTPKPLAHHKRAEKIAARAIHYFFYAALIALPLSGWIMSSAKDFGVSVFNLFTLPHLVGPDEQLANTSVSIHVVLAYMLMAAIALHAAGALKHHFIDRDETLRRMLPFAHAERNFKSLLCILGAMMLWSAHAQAQDAPRWIISADESSIQFSGKQMGAPFTGTFGAFSGEIMFDEAAPEAGNGLIEIDMDTARTGGADRDKNMKDDAWFAVKSFPKAHYKIEQFEKAGEGNYLAKGTLTIRDISRPLNLPFALDISPNAAGVIEAKALGSVTIKRLDFGVGQGDWKDTSTIGDEVEITVNVKAVRQ